MNKFEDPNCVFPEQESLLVSADGGSLGNKEAESKENKEEKITSFEQAAEIMGDRFFGPERIKTYMNIDVKDVPEIPYSPETLKQAVVSGANLILRIDSDNNGNTLTMEELQKKLRFKGGSNSLGFLQEKFYKNDHPNAEWKIVLERLSLGKNYFQSTLDIYKYLEKINFLSEDEKKEFPSEQSLIDYFNQLNEQVIFDWRGGNGYDGANNWREISKKLANIKVNKAHRRTPVETLYDRLLDSGETLKSSDAIFSFTPDTYDSSNTLSSDSRLLVTNGQRIEFGPHPGYEFLRYGTAVQY
ncbi:MAG: hypothetical protein WC319_03220 [Candidatus Paceibacterota bacterium]|jgi:hypothetical protein